MKKVTISLALSILMVFALGGVAFAFSYPTTHSGFGVASSACAGCHVTHAANAKYLLNTSGATQTAFCYECHGNNTGSPYDVDEGRIQKSSALEDAWAGTDYYASISGGFGYNADGVNSYAATSKHDVENLTTPASDLAGSSIPGNSNSGTMVGGFRCGSCHDPHDATNTRLLRQKPYVQSAVYSVSFGMGAGDASYTVADYGTNANINAWCGACHDKLNAVDDSAKGAGYMGKFRHAMGISVTSADVTDKTLATGTPLSKTGADVSGNNLLTCLSCHRAHGTTATVTGHGAAWTRESGGTSSSSVLLRMNERGVCYNCHQGATKNLEATGQGNT